MDARLRLLVRQYVLDHSDEAAHAIAREVSRLRAPSSPASIKHLAANLIEITKTDGTELLIFYETVIAARIADEVIYTSQGKANTRTSRKHINAWHPEAFKRFVDAERLSELL